MRDIFMPIPRALFLVLAAFVWATSPHADAAAPKWAGQRYQYAAEGKPLREVLRDFASSQGMAVTISSDIDGVVAGKFDLPPAGFVDLMARAYGFLWYFDGAVLHIVSAKDIQTRVIKLSAGTTLQLREAIGRLGLDAVRFPLKYDDATNTAIVQGPVPYVALVLEMAARLEARSAKTGTAQIRIFPLRNTWAADRPGGQPNSPVVRGMVSMLRDLHGRSADSPLAAGSAKDGAASMRAVQAAMFGSGESASGMSGMSGMSQLRSTPTWASGGRNDEGKAAQAVQPTPTLRASDSPENDTEKEQLPMFQADAASNSVIVRDLPERMPQYEKLIADLDRRVSQLEVEVQIIEMQGDALDELGVDWRLHSSRLDAQTGSGRGTQPGFNGALSGAADASQAAAKGSVLTAVLGNSGRYLLARIGAYADQGRARFVARPKVATLNFQEAVISSQQTLHVKVEAFQSAQLFELQAGTVLRVTPAASNENGAWRIRLNVSVQDGTVMEQTVSDIPIISTNRIDTQAVVNDGESLLLAGYTTEKEEVRRSGVPGLSSLPGIGKLFRYETRSTKNLVRLFLVSPRILP